ncbi:hypothetical protein [Noviherbaspirillum aerium]|uniref:hypothetical protein n=1 Tax=Noviherbaspirillum aerium TaxID=2588497 RepID=UPI00178C4933|nr:hypothetical protein [Noviherbaspirillum aerium]
MFAAVRFYPGGIDNARKNYLHKVQSACGIGVPMKRVPGSDESEGERPCVGNAVLIC